MQILSKTNPSETKVTNTGVSKPPQIGGRAVSRSRGLENNFFLLPKPFSENSRSEDSKNVRFLRFQPFLAEKMALEVKKARFNPFVLPSDFFKSDGDPVYLHVTLLTMRRCYLVQMYGSVKLCQVHIASFSSGL